MEPPDAKETAALHAILLRDDGERTRAECSCGGWRREADSEDVKLTGRSREEILRAAFEAHIAGMVPLLRSP